VADVDFMAVPVWRQLERANSYVVLSDDLNNEALYRYLKPELYCT
jgi:hypothetical protein